MKVTLYALFLLLLIPSAALSEPIQLEANENYSWSFETTDGCSIYVSETGRGMPTIVLHGGPGSDHSLLRKPLLFLQNEVRLVFLDQRGSLRSPCPKEVDLSLTKIYDDLNQLRKIRNFKEVNIIAHSFGAGVTAPSYYAMYPDGIKKVVSITPVPMSGNFHEVMTAVSEQRGFLANRETLDKELKKEGLDRNNEPENAFEKSLWVQMKIAAENLYDIALWRETSNILLFIKMETQRRILESLPDPWRYTQPVNDKGKDWLIITTNFDMLPLSFHRKWLDEVPNVKLKIVGNAGHLVWLDRPRIFRKLILQHLHSR